METKIVYLDEKKINKEIIRQAGKILKSDGLVGFPTETVYGLGANGLSERAVKKIFAAKGRPQDNPLILHVASMEQVKDLVEEIPEKAKIAMEKFWPGPLTILFKKSKLVPDIITAGLDTVAIRMPESKIALELIREAKLPIAAPSANLSGKASPTSAKHVIEDLSGKIDMIIDGGSTGIGLESTVLDLSAEPPMILRPGKISLEDLREIMANVVEDTSLMRDDIVPRSPGQKYKHYAPKAEMLVYSGNKDDIVKAIIEATSEYIGQGKKVGIMSTDETRDFYKEGLVLSLGSRADKESIAHNLFKLIRLFDEKNVDVILSEGVDLSDIGMAIMNRMMKAASGKIIKV